MRELIKTGAYNFTAGTRVINITDGRSFTKNDVLLIYNKTQNISLYSVALNDNITVSGTAITLSNSLPVLNSGDELSIQIDFPQEKMVAITHTQPVNFTTLSSTINIQETGLLTSIDDLSSAMILKIGASSYVALSLPSYVNKGESLSINVNSIGVKKITIQKNSTSSSVVSTGSLTAKVMSNGGTFAYYSPALSKILICGLALFDENEKFICGDGNAGFIASLGQFFYNKHHYEYNGLLYYYSMERGSLIELNLSSGAIRWIASLPVYQMEIINNILYVNTAIKIVAIDLTTLSQTAFTYSSNLNTFIPFYSDGTSIYQANYGSPYLFKITGTTQTNVSSGGVPGNYHPVTIVVGNYVYMLNCGSMYKYNTSDLSWVATLVTGVNYQDNKLFTNASGSQIYCLSNNGQIKVIETTGFTVLKTITIGVTSTFQCSIEILNNKAYIFSGNGRGSDIARSFSVLNMNDDTVANYLPPSSGLNLNTHNAMNIDPVNNRLIFFGVNTSGVNTYNVEIINIP